MSGYVPIEDGPLEVGVAITRYGAAAIPQMALDDPKYHAITHVSLDGSYTLCALTPRYFAERTSYRLVRDNTTGRLQLLYRCPEDGELLEHVYAHWNGDGTHKRGAR